MHGLILFTSIAIGTPIAAASCSPVNEPWDTMAHFKKTTVPSLRGIRSVCGTAFFELKANLKGLHTR